MYKLISTCSLILALLGVACDRDATPPHKTPRHEVDAAPSTAAASCTTSAEFDTGSCCWQGQTRTDAGQCTGVPSSCPEPLMVFPPEQRCDACAGSPSCAEALADCGTQGETCLDVGSRFVVQSQGLKEDLMRATSLFLAACEAGSLIACNNVGIHYKRGVGIPRDEDRAMAFFEKACPREQPIAPGCDNLARSYRARQEHERADALLTLRCEKFKSADECSSLINRLVIQPIAKDDLAAHQARMLELGELACTPDEQKGCTQLATLLRMFHPEDAAKMARATALLETACDKNTPAACLELAKIAQQSEGGGQPDHVRAFALYEKACKLNLFAACGPLAMFYLRIDVPAPEGNLSADVRRKRARQLGQLACTRGELSGCNALALLVKGGDEQAKQALVDTRAQVQAQCVSQKTPMGCALLGELEVRGLGGERDLKQGIAHLEQACKAGVVGACQRRAGFADPKARIDALDPGQRR